MMITKRHYGFTIAECALITFIVMVWIMVVIPIYRQHNPFHANELEIGKMIQAPISAVRGVVKKSAIQDIEIKTEDCIQSTHSDACPDN